MASSPRNGMDKRLMHKRLYKNARGRTPPWKDVYRQRCMERLRTSRFQLVNSFRAAAELTPDSIAKAKMVQEIMEVEWTAMNQANGFHTSKKWPGSNDELCEEDQSIMWALMEEIQMELMSEEEKILNELLNYDAEALSSQVAAQQSEEVICPVCQVQVLKESTGGGTRESSISSFANGTGAVSKVLTCSCGLALQGANLTLSTVKSSLENTVSHHGQTCVGKMSFTPTTDTQGTNVLSTCNLCDWMSFLL